MMVLSTDLTATTATTDKLAGVDLLTAAAMLGVWLHLRRILTARKGCHGTIASTSNTRWSNASVQGAVPSEESQWEAGKVSAHVQGIC